MCPRKRVNSKLHLDAADGGVPLSCILTSASVHDSQVAIPLAAMTAGRVNNLYDLMDSAYDAAEIRAYSESLGHVPIIDRNPRRDAALKEPALGPSRRPCRHPVDVQMTLPVVSETQARLDRRVRPSAYGTP